MSFETLAWLFVLATAIHNTEEAIWLPAWSVTAGRWHHPVTAREFRFAVSVLTMVAALVAVLAVRQGRGSVGAYLLCGYALAMALNVAMPHVLGSIVMRRYVPGTATAVVLNLPITIALLQRGLADGYIDGSRFPIVGPLVVVGIIAAIPLLFRVARPAN